MDPFQIFQIAAPILGSFLSGRNTSQAANETMRALQEFIEEMTTYIQEAAAQADVLIAGGEDQAAADLIKYTKEGVAEVWRGAELGEEGLREFMGQTNELFEPIINQGRFAADEQARMLGIPNAAGELEAWAPSLIEETPGFKFRQEWGTRGVENTAIGRYLSGQTAQELAEYNQGLAGQYFDTRFDQLGTMAQRGADAATTQGTLYGNAGATLAQLYGQAGGNAGNLLGGLGSGLADIRMNSALSRAGLLTQAASTIANMGIAGMTGQNQGLMSLTANQNATMSDMLQGLSRIGSLTNNTPPTTVGTWGGTNIGNTPIGGQQGINYGGGGSGIGLRLDPTPSWGLGRMTWSHDIGN